MHRGTALEVPPGLLGDTADRTGEKLASGAFRDERLDGRTYTMHASP
jgi:hypothetical protein